MTADDDRERATVGIRPRLPGVVARVAAVQRQRRRALAQVRREQALLRRGLYLAEGDGVWRHWRAKVPAHLRATKGRGEVRHGHLVTGPDRLRRLAWASIPPRAFLNLTRRTGRYSLAVAAWEGGAVLLDPERRQVARSYGTGAIDREQVAWRQRFGRYVPAPAFVVRENGRLVIEDFVDGRHFLDVGRREQFAVLARLLSCFARLVRHEGEGTSEQRVAAAFTALEGVELPVSLDELVDRDEMLERSRDWPLVPSATDAKLKNLMVHDGMPVPVDLGNIRLDPFFSYPLGLIGEARSHLLRDYVVGRFDTPLRELFDAAGAPAPATPAERRALLGVRTIITSHNEATRSGELDRTVLRQALHRRWAEIWSDRPPSRR